MYIYPKFFRIHLMKKTLTIALSFIVLFSFAQEVEKVNGIDKSDISKIGGVDVGDISKVMGIDFSTDACNGETSFLYEGLTYSIVAIGSQCWMAENLNVGTRINGVNEQTNNSTLEKYCYDDLESNCDIYGGLYQWDEMMQYVTTEGAQGICPSGWHIPSDAEWTALTTYLGGESVAGGKMKSTGTIEAVTGLWYDPNAGATNESGFTGLPGGYRYYYYGSFDDRGIYGHFWSSTEYSGTHAWDRNLLYYYAYVGRVYNYKTYGFSVRCIED